MIDLVRFIAESLVENPEGVSVTEKEEDGMTVYELSVDPKDMGRVIGKHGKIAKSIRTVVKAAAAGSDKKVTVEIV